MTTRLLRFDSVLSVSKLAVGMGAESGNAKATIRAE